LEWGGIGNEGKGLVGGGEGVAVAVEGGGVCSVAGWRGVGSVRVTDPTWVKQPRLRRRGVGCAFAPRDPDFQVCGRLVAIVDESNTSESEYRILLGDQVKYILVDPRTDNSDILSFPPDLLDQLPELPLGDWARARIFKRSGTISFELSYGSLAGVRSRWHSKVVDVLSLTLLDRLRARVHVVAWGSKQAVAKIARFEFEITLMEKETAIYEAIDGHGIGPAFLGHLIEHGRVMGFLIEKVEGRHGHIGDLEASQKVTKRLHSLGIVHGDLNRYNFIVSAAGVTLIDFENATRNGSREAMEMEYKQIAEQLMEEMGRDGGNGPRWHSARME
jgi:predicted Ser/Thr protein kinase